MKRSPGALALALYSNTPEARNELLFRKGDVLTVIEYDYEGQTDWWLCSHRGQRGICPSNYLQLLEDNYSLIGRRPELRQSLSHNTTDDIGSSHESALKGDAVDGVGIKKDEGKGEQVFDPSETYDVPRSVCMQSLSKSSDPLLDASVLYSNQNQPLYQNEQDFSLTKTSPLDLYDVPRSHLPVYGQSLSRLRRYGHQTSETSLAQRPKGGISGSLQSFNDWNNFSSASSKHSSSSVDLGLPPTGAGAARGSGSSNRSSPDNSSSSSRSSNSSGKNITTIPEQRRSQTLSRLNSQEVQLRRPKPLMPTCPINHSNRSSVQSESAESGIGMVSSPPNQDDLYDTPRSTAVPVHNQIGVGGTGGHNGVGQSNGTSCSRPQSSLSVSSSGMGLSIANSDSKDSLDLYDVPRSAKSYVNHMETKYDHVQHRHGSVSSESGHTSFSRDSTLTKSNGGGGGHPGHSRHNSTSSIFSAYGYSRETSNFPDGRRPSAGMNSNMGSRSSLASGFSSSNNHQGSISYNSGNDLYDVPRSSGPPPNPRTHKLGGGISSASVASCSRSQNSLLSDSSNELYDVPPSFAKKVSLTDSSETLSCKGSSDGDGRSGSGSLSRSELRLGASSSSLMSSKSMSTSSRGNNHFRRRESNGVGVKSGLIGSNDGAGTGADVKILPLGPKAAVSVCEKLRHEVVTSIASILNQVKPKWRSKENLTAIMPDLRFSCTRLSLAIKDVAEFATRAMSNAKQIGDEALVSKLQRLITPVMNGSGIIQRDVDELDAYFWSPERLSVSSGSHHEKNASGDALDQLILCARSLKHDVTEIANFLALNSSTLFRDQQDKRSTFDGATTKTTPSQMVEPEPQVQEDDDYVNLVPGTENESDDKEGSNSPSSVIKSKPELSSRPSLTSTPLQLDSRDEQLLEFYSAQIGLTAPLLSQSISTFISAIHQNDPPESFNIHLKYVILFAYRMLFGGDIVHRNVNNVPLKMEIESRANDLHKSILALYESSKVATMEFPKIGPMQNIVDKVWGTTQAATQLKKVIFNATCATL